MHELNLKFLSCIEKCNLLLGSYIAHARARYICILLAYLFYKIL